MTPKRGLTGAKASLEACSGSSIDIGPGTVLVHRAFRNPAGILLTGIIMLHFEESLKLPVTLVSDCDNTLWDAVANQPLDTLSLQPGERSIIFQYFFFRHQPCIDRVIFMAVPHRGSRLAAGIVGSIADRLIRRSRTPAELLGELASEYPGILTPYFARVNVRGGPTSLFSLVPNPLLDSLAALPIRVPFQVATAYFQNPQSATATNFAVGGATSGEGDVFINSLPGFQTQVLTYLNSGQQVSGNDLYVIWIGANDFSAEMEPAQTVANIKNGIAELSAKGARTFVIITVPDISLTPLVKSLGEATVLAAKRFVLTTNVLLAVELPQLALLHGITINLADINAIFVPLVYSPGSFGFTNSTGAAYNTTTGVVVSDPNEYVFWDGFHPTTDVHYLGAQFIFRATFLRPQFHNFLSIR